MTTVEHAKQIYSLLLAAKMQSGQKMPINEELTNLVRASFIYSKAFEQVELGKK